MNSPLISAILPCYKMAEFVGYALESIGIQTHDAWEAIIVDDCGPEDGTKDIVAKFSERFPDHRIEFIRHEKNTGVSGARNTAIEHAKGEYIAFLDPDDLWMPGYLERIAKEFSLHDDVDVITTPPEAFQFKDGREIVDPLSFTEEWQIGKFPASLATGNFLQPSSTVVRRSVLVSLGGFDTTPELQHIEDYDLWIRLAENGHGFHFVNENLTRYRKHPSAATSNKQMMARLHERLSRKHSDFFISSQAVMISALIGRLERTREAIRNPLAFALRRLTGRG